MTQSHSSGELPRPPQTDRRSTLVALGIIAILLVTLVGVYQFLPGSGTPTPSSPGTLSPYAQLFAQVGPNGEVTKEMALEAFSLAIAPLPGVTVPTGAPPADYERFDGTFAVQWMLPYEDQITPEQKAAVDVALAPDPHAPVHTPSTAGSAVSVELADENPAQHFSDGVLAAIPTIEGRLGRKLHTSWSVTLNQTEQQANGKPALAWNAPEIYPILGLIGCDIHVNPSLANSGDEAEIRASIAHEAFHCFQFEYLDEHGGYRALPAWIMEGQAEWAGESVAGPSSVGAGWWADYLTSPQRPLWQRTYDAVGFYQHLAEEGIDPWTHFDATFAAFLGASQASDANSDTFKAAGAAADSFLDTWASGFFRDPVHGGPWNAAGPWTWVSSKAQPQVVVVNAGEVRSASAARATNTILSVVATADIIEARGENNVRMHIGSVPELPVVQRWLCIKNGGCKCPPGERFSGPELEDAGGNSTIYFGITGSLGGAEVRVVGHNLGEYCKTWPSQGPLAPGTSCGANCGNSNGDPHLRTINRYRYDFQAAGEFVLLRSPDSSLEIQARQQPYNHGVSTNKAIGMRDNGHTVGVYVTPEGLVAHVDGSPTDLSNAVDLGSDASVSAVANGVQISFPDGTKVVALSVAIWGINAVVYPSDALAANGMGLLGPITPDGMGVPALPDGTQLPAAPDVATREATLYGQFADAWRVSDATTLFDYDAGKSTDSYTDPNFPSDADRETLAAAMASPDPARQAAAQSTCARVTDEDLQADCYFDVYATGDDSFASQYEAQQYLYDGGIEPTIEPTLVPSPPAYSPNPVVPAMNGATKILDRLIVAGSAMGPDDTIYISFGDPLSGFHLAAIDPRTAAVKQTIETRHSTDIHFVDGSIWASGMVVDDSGEICNVTRYDPVTLAEQTTFAIPCKFAYEGPQLESTGDAAWFVDTSRYDSDTDSGAQMTRIDPATNVPGRSVALGYMGYCQEAQGAMFCTFGNGDVWGLTSDSSAFVDLGAYSGIYPAGAGFWTEMEDGSDTAVYVNATGGVRATVPLNRGDLVGGDTNAAYVESPDFPYQLLRQPDDGSAAVQIATAPVWAAGTIDETSFEYLLGGPLKFAAPDGFATIWQFQDSAYLQWAPLP